MTIKVAVTGAAGQIGYALLFRVASGALSASQTIDLQLLETEKALPALDGVEMELRDCAFSPLNNVVKTAMPEQAFADADVIFLVGAQPRGAGMERKDLLEANASIFSRQGQAINSSAKKTARVLVVGNPANTNCLIARQNAPDMPDHAWSAMTRLDHNRALAQIAEYTGQPLSAIKKMIIWGNHSATQYPDIHHCTVDGVAATDCIEQNWYKNTMIPAVQQRGAAIIKARGASSAASAASAAIDHMRDWLFSTTTADDAVSLGVISNGDYGIEKGLVYSFPIRHVDSDSRYQIISGLDINEFSAAKLKLTEKELQEERDAVSHLLP